MRRIAAMTVVALLLLLGPHSEGRAQDRIELQGTSIIGSQELPKILYIVPWKQANADNLMGNPIGNMVRETLEPVDRSVFLREVEYYEQFLGDGTAAAPKN